MKTIGGQAVIEGVMMKSRRGWTVAVRGHGGEIHIKREPLGEPPALLRLPLLRGVAALYHALALGIKALEFSANKAYEAEAGKPMGRFATALTIGAAMLLGIGLFILLPLYMTKLIGMGFPAVSEGAFLFNLVDGLIRVAAFLLYIWAIGRWAEMRRVFEYHGAEHKVINAYEAGSPLRPEDVAPFSVRHPRCGTSFLLIVMVLSIVVFSFIPQKWPLIYKFSGRLLLIPAVAGLSYELLRLSARKKENPLMRLLTAPGLFLQGLTTREPDSGQIEVAIKALEEALSFEEKDAR